MATPSLNSRRLSPGRVWMLVLLILFVAETVVMQVIDVFPTLRRSRFVESFADAACLTCLAAPVIWWLLIRPLQEASRLRSQFLSDLFSSIEADRRRTASELHDGVGQSLTILISGLRSAASEIRDEGIQQRCHHLQELAVQVLDDVKRLSLGLRPAILDDLGLVAALEKLTRETQNHHSLSAELVITSARPDRLAPEIETGVFRIAQEALANVVEHARARHVSVHFSSAADHVELWIIDDGIGIPNEQLSGPNPGHLGLVGMRERASLLGGRLMISSGQGEGTRISVRIPISKG